MVWCVITGWFPELDGDAPILNGAHVNTTDIIIVKLFYCSEKKTESLAILVNKYEFLNQCIFETI